MQDYFEFRDPGHLLDGDLELVLVKKDPFDPVTGWVPQYHFEMRHPGENAALGSIRLRIGSSTALRFAGHIGYDVKPEFRGNDYAARASRLLLALAYSHGLKEVYLNVDPQNVASVKTCEKIGAERFETIHLKKDPFLLGGRYPLPPALPGGPGKSPGRAKTRYTCGQAGALHWAGRQHQNRPAAWQPAPLS